MKTAYPRTTTINEITVRKNKRGALMNWGELHSMSDNDVNTQLIQRLGRSTNNETLRALGAFTAFNPASCSFDYPEEDFTRLLLGALKAGLVSILEK